MALTFPPDCETPAKRTEYCYRAQELLRRLHNVMGAWYREGIAQTKYDKLPLKIKNRYAYTPRLSEAAWLDFTADVFEPISRRITEKLLENRQHLFDSTTWAINVEDI